MTTATAHIHFGVIDQARARQRRARRRAIGLVVLLIIAGDAAFGLFDDGAGRATRSPLPAPGQVSGSLQAVNPGRYRLWVTPALSPGGPALTVFVHTSAETSFDDVAAYPGPALPIERVNRVNWRSASGRPVIGPGAVQLLLVAANVAAVRVGGLGIASARRVAALPAGEKLVAFGLSRSDVTQAVGGNGSFRLTALDGHGQALGSISPASGAQPPVLRHAVNASSVAAGARCAVASRLAGLSLEHRFAAQTITRVPGATAGAFLSCVNDTYVYRGAAFNVAILLDANRPTAAPAPLWGVSAVPGHPGIVEHLPPRSANPSTAPSHPPARIRMLPNPVLARRIGHAWLVIQAAPGRTVAPTRAETIRVLDGVRAAPIELATRASRG